MQVNCSIVEAPLLAAYPPNSVAKSHLEGSLLEPEIALGQISISPRQGRAATTIRIVLRAVWLCGSHRAAAARDTLRPVSQYSVGCCWSGRAVPGARPEFRTWCTARFASSKLVQILAVGEEDRRRDGKFESEEEYGLNERWSSTHRGRRCRQIRSRAQRQACRRSKASTKS